MDTQRLVLFIVFSFSVFFLFDAWQREHRPAPVPAVAEPGQVPAPTGPSATPVPTPSQPLNRSASAPPPATSGALSKAQKIRVATDLYVAQIDTAGADLRSLELLTHRDTLDQKKTFMLLQEHGDHVYVAQSGLIGSGMPNHRTVYAAEGNDFKLAPGQENVSVRLTAAAADGVHVTKIYTFHRDSYVIDVAFEIVNKSGAALRPDAYFQLVRDAKPPAGDSAMLPTYTGLAVYTEKEKFTKVAFADIDKGKASFQKKSSDGWIAILQHYFVSAWLPPVGTPREFYIQKLDNGLYSAGVIVPAAEVQPGGKASVMATLYAGPQEQEKLSTLAPGLDLTVDYGWLTVIAAPLFWLLQFIYGGVGNWGIAIIILTVIIKAIFYPLSAASYRSMAKMRVMAPKLQKIKEQYGNDRQRLNQAMMEIYKTEKINPLGGCLPILVQIPVFIALYWVLLASVEIRQAPFMLWINDLSAPDPYFVLPVLMGATMIFQTYLNPVPPDPVQAKVMKIMPIAFSIFFFFFPAGLVLYWLVNNILSIAQQWQITRAMEHPKPAHGK